VAILEKCHKPAVFMDQFKIEEFVDPKITPISEGAVILRHMIINPLFSHQAKWFIEVSKYVMSGKYILLKFPLYRRCFDAPASASCCIR
jgi:hypothetical protein